MSPMAWPLQPNPATRMSSFSSIEFKQPSLGTKAVIFCHSWWAEPWHISWWQNLVVWLQPLLFWAQFSWHEKCFQKGWPSGLCPNGLSCTTYHAASGLVGGYRNSWQYEDCDICPFCQCHGPEQKTIVFNFNIRSEGIRSPILQHFRTLINVIGLLTDAACEPRQVGPHSLSPLHPSPAGPGGFPAQRPAQQLQPDSPGGSVRSFQALTAP